MSSSLSLPDSSGMGALDFAAADLELLDLALILGSGYVQVRDPL